MTDMTVARSILDQLGGARFVAMTGARELVGSADSLTFKIGVNPKRVSQGANVYCKHARSSVFRAHRVRPVALGPERWG